MTAEPKSRGLCLPQGQTSSSYFHGLLEQACLAFPELSGACIPSSLQEFKRDFDKLLPRFELSRVKSPRRTEIARFICQRADLGLRFATESSELSLEDAWKKPVRALPLVQVNLPGLGRLMPSVAFEGRLHESARLTGLIHQFEEQRRMTPSARDGLLWVNELARSEGGLSLHGRRFVLLGAGAELAPVDLLLGAGADVLWLDLRDPEIDRLLSPRLSGSLRFVRGGADLITAPQSVAATIEHFAGAGPVHICMYAYSGRRELAFELSCAMNAVVNRLPSELVASVTTLLSTSTPASVCAEDRLAAKLKAENPTRLVRSLLATRALRYGFEEDDRACIARSYVKALGESYQAAHYVGKMLAAEAYAVYGSRFIEVDRAPEALTVSANVTPITSTKSLLASPVFEAALLGARAFDIGVAEPETSRTVSGMLSLHDLLHPGAPGSRSLLRTPNQRAEALLSQQIHGGLYAQPYALESCIRVAALRGLTQKPKLALSLFR